MRERLQPILAILAGAWIAAVMVVHWVLVWARPPR
jgi:hypothetical protein